MEKRRTDFLNFKALLRNFSWSIKEGEDQKLGSCADLYAEHKDEVQNFVMLIDDGMINQYNEVMNIYVLDDNSKRCTIFSGVCKNREQFIVVMEVLGFPKLNMLDHLKFTMSDFSEEENQASKDFFDKDSIPKGWISINDHLPQWLAKDSSQGYSEYRVKEGNGSEFETRVSDPQMFLVYAKEVGITHWLNT